MAWKYWKVGFEAKNVCLWNMISTAPQPFQTSVSGNSEVWNYWKYMLQSKNWHILLTSWWQSQPLKIIQMLPPKDCILKRQVRRPETNGSAWDARAKTCGSAKLCTCGMPVTQCWWCISFPAMLKWALGGFEPPIFENPAQIARAKLWADALATRLQGPLMYS